MQCIRWPQAPALAVLALQVGFHVQIALVASFCISVALNSVSQTTSRALILLFTSMVGAENEGSREGGVGR